MPEILKKDFLNVVATYVRTAGRWLRDRLFQLARKGRDKPQDDDHQQDMVVMSKSMNFMYTCMYVSRSRLQSTAYCINHSRSPNQVFRLSLNDFPSNKQSVSPSDERPTYLGIFQRYAKDFILQRSAHSETSDGWIVSDFGLRSNAAFTRGISLYSVVVHNFCF